MYISVSWKSFKHFVVVNVRPAISWFAGVRGATAGPLEKSIKYLPTWRNLTTIQVDTGRMDIKNYSILPPPFVRNDSRHRARRPHGPVFWTSDVRKNNNYSPVNNTVRQIVSRSAAPRVDPARTCRSKIEYIPYNRCTKQKKKNDQNTETFEYIASTEMKTSKTSADRKTERPAIDVFMSRPRRRRRGKVLQRAPTPNGSVSRGTTGRTNRKSIPATSIRVRLVTIHGCTDRSRAD